MAEHTPAKPARRAKVGSDRVAVALFSLSAFLLVLALLGAQLIHAHSTTSRASTPVLIRRIYRTTVVERLIPASSRGNGGDSVKQSVSGSSSVPSFTPMAPVTRTS
jgi:hypothetical protein